MAHLNLLLFIYANVGNHMKKTNLLTKQFSFLLLIFISYFGFGQLIDEPFSQKKIEKDLAVFKEIRLKANSGLYKYRTKNQIDSIYNWAESEIKNITTYREFHNLIIKLTDFEGSLHNRTNIPKKILQNLRKEESGYFPLPIKWIDEKWIVNFKNGEIPLGAEIISVNDILISNLISELGKYYSTDGINITGKRIGIRTHFARYFRLKYGLQDTFKVIYKKHNDNKEIVMKSVSYAEYYSKFRKRHSLPFDGIYYATLKDNQKYNFKKLDSLTGVLTLNSFAIGENAESPAHIKFAKYLDSLFIDIKSQNIKNLIVDIRYNGGGTDPNELIPYEYLTKRKFSENKSAWVSFQKIPYLRYIKTKVPSFLRPLGVLKYNKYFRKEFPIEKNGEFYQSSSSEDHKIRKPNKNTFTGNIYLLINPEVASAGSNFGSLLASNDNVLIIGEETQGGYYGHNGHTPMSYILPKSNITTTFSIVNLEQYVIKKPNQIYGRGIIPDINISQSFEDFLNNEDTQMAYTLELINKK